MLTNDVFRLQARAENEEQLLAELANLAKSAFQVDAAEILLLMGTDLVVMRASTMAPELVGRVRFSPQVGVTGYVLRTGEIVEHGNQQRHPNEILYPGYNEEHFESSVFAPLRVDTQSIGVLVLRHLKPKKMRASDRQRLERTAEAVAFCIAGWRRAFQLGGNADRIGALSEVTQIIATSPYVEEILQLLVNVTARQFNYKVCTVRLIDESSQELVLRATQAQSVEYQRKRSIRLGESIAGRAVEERRPIMVPDVQSDKEYIGHDLAVEQRLRSMICVPLTVEDRALGVLTCYTEEPHDFLPSEVKALETIAQQAAFSIERAKLQVRSTLMQEMHHRVKNNLQQVVSLLRLQLRHKHYANIEVAINDSISRILAISAVHDLLSREDLDRVDLKTIAANLIGHIQQSMLLPNNKMVLDVRGDVIRLSMTQATQVALVLNELLLNALEHGVAGHDEAQIHITFKREGEDVVLWVANNGNPLPKDFDIQTASNLGLQIVTSLARGLGGNFTLVDSHGWAVAEVRFPVTSAD